MPRDIDNIDNQTIDELDEELEFIRSQKPKHMEKVKLDKGEAALIRFYPHIFGEGGKWFVRYGQHWVGNRTYFCQRLTSAVYGGNANIECPFCTLSEKYANSSVPAIQVASNDLRADAVWMAYAFEWERMIGQDRRTHESPSCHALKEVHLTRNLFEYAITKQRQKVTGSNKLGFLDPVNGCDFWFGREKKYSLEIEGPSAWAKTDDGIEEIYSNAEKSVIEPRINFLSGDALDKVFADAKQNVVNGIVTNKYSLLYLKDLESKQKASANKAGGLKSRGDAEEHEEEEAPKAPIRRAPASVPTRAPAAANEEELRPVRRAPAPAPIQEEQESEAPQEEAPKPVKVPVSLTPPARRVVPTSAPVKVIHKEEALPEPGDDEDDEAGDVPTEKSDSAPVAQDDVEVNDAPPKVSVSGTESAGKLKGSILDRLRARNSA